MKAETYQLFLDVESGNLTPEQAQSELLDLLSDSPLKMKNYILDVRAGNIFTDVAQIAKQIAKEKGLTVEFDFNGVCCLVNTNTNLDWLYRDYLNSCWTLKCKTVGADCVEKYSEEV